MSRYEIEFYKRGLDNSFKGRTFRTIEASTDLEREIMGTIGFAHDMTGNGAGIGHATVNETADTPIVFIDESKTPSLESQIIQRKYGLRPDKE
jgi:hypothetical protein